MVIDTATKNGLRADERLRAEVVAWLVTVDAKGVPHPTPVWFWWDGRTILVYSQRDKPKLRSVAANPRVSVALRTDRFGDEITVVSGVAAIDPSAPAADELPGYVGKYANLIARLGMDPRSFAAEYAVPIRITPRRLRQWRSASAG